MKFYMHQRIIGENLIKIGLILSAQWRFSEERYQACPVTLNHAVLFVNLLTLIVTSTTDRFITLQLNHPFVKPW